MDANLLNFCGKAINRIGFGCWQLAGDYDLHGRPSGYGTIDIAESERAIHYALDNGITFFDTAVAYGFGRSEELLGAALRSYPGAANENVVVCTKYGMVLGDSGDSDDFSAKNFIVSVEGSLRRLGADRLGVMLLHNPPDDYDFSLLDRAPFDKMITDGKIQAYGVSCKTQKGVANVIDHGFGSVIEAVYNVLDRRYENFFADPLNKNKYTFICRVPLASGFISPRTLAGSIAFADNDIRSGFNQEQVEWVTDSVRKLSFLQDMPGGIAVSALRFELSNPYNTLTIPGIKNTKQATDAVMAMKLGPLPPDVISSIAEAVPEVFYKWR